MRLFSRFRWMLVAALLMSIAASLCPPPARANELQQQLEQAQRDLENLRRQQKETQNSLADVTFQAQEAEAQLRLVEGELMQANGELAVISEELETVTVELEQVEADLAETQERFDAKKKVLATRIRAMRESGRISQLSVLFGASSFRDFIGRADRLGMVLKKDRTLVEEVKAEKVALEQKQREVTEQKNRMELLKAAAESRRTTIVAKRSEREAVSRTLQDSRRSLQLQLDEYERHSDYLAEQVAEIVRQINRQGGVFAPISPVTPVLITDPYGMRDHPILGGRRMHWGTDFNAYWGQPVRAVEAGVVISTSYDDVFGNLVIIDHGGGITSWYAHNSSILVSPNQTVTQGQQIANAGSTGWSTGPHVHMELHMNGERVDPMDYITY